MRGRGGGGGCAEAVAKEAKRICREDSRDRSDHLDCHRLTTRTARLLAAPSPILHSR